MIRSDSVRAIAMLSITAAFWLVWLAMVLLVLIVPCGGQQDSSLIAQCAQRSAFPVFMWTWPGGLFGYMAARNVVDAISE